MKDTKEQQENWQQVQNALWRLECAVEEMKDALPYVNKRLGYGQSSKLIAAASDLHAMHIKACMQQGALKPGKCSEDCPKGCTGDKEPKKPKPKKHHPKCHLLTYGAGPGVCDCRVSRKKTSKR